MPVRSLIRPFLFTVARLGLFLAVAAWVSSARYRIDMGQWMANTVFAQSSDEHGWRFIYSHVSQSKWDFWFELRKPGLIPGSIDRSDSVGRIGISGVVTYWTEPSPLRGRSCHCVDICHWLFTTTFIILNLFLLFMYRKRPEPEPCED